MSKQQAAPGSWDSKIHANLVASGSTRRADVRSEKHSTYWLESLALEQGRMTIMRHENGQAKSILPQPFNVRSKVHEYGGSPYCIANDAIFFINASDQGLYSIDKNDLTQPQPIYQDNTRRFADLIWIEEYKSIIAVCEEHTSDQQVENYLVRIDLKGKLHTLERGSDFYAYPRFCEQSRQLCWISWQHPNMPWDSTQLWVAHINNEGFLDNRLQLITDIDPQSVVQPTWHQNGDLYFVSDINNWWNLYRIRKSSIDHGISNREFSNEDIKCIRSQEAEYATPLWVLGMQNYALTDNYIYAAYTKNGAWYLDKISLNSNDSENILSDLSTIESVSNAQYEIRLIASNYESASSVYALELDRGKLKELSSHSETPKEELSKPESILTPIDKKNSIQAFYYPPFNSSFESNEKPPLIVICHGGPTGQTSSELNYKIQYWTNRGFAVVDINYRGSTGFGKDFRHSLYKNWGVSDVEDMCSVVKALITQGKVDEEKIIIKGGSAGGYTVLAALAFTRLFSAGVSLYGIGDLELLASDTHKFEKYYLDQLIGSYPEARPLYQSRSPINSIDKFDCPILLFQGLEDKVVPPNQARTIEQGLDKNRIPVALIEFPDEGHGFRSPKNIKHMLEAELYFYQKVFELATPSENDLIHIKHLD